MPAPDCGGRERTARKLLSKAGSSSRLQYEAICNCCVSGGPDPCQYRPFRIYHWQNRSDHQYRRHGRGHVSALLCSFDRGPCRETRVTVGHGRAIAVRHTLRICGVIVILEIRARSGIVAGRSIVSICGGGNFRQSRLPLPTNGNQQGYVRGLFIGSSKSRQPQVGNVKAALVGSVR